MSGRTFLPASCIRPSLSNRRTRSLLSSVHELLRLRGDKRCNNRPSEVFFLTPSIQPKHNASSTASRYKRVFGSGFKLTGTQQQDSVVPCSCNQFLNSSLEVKVSIRSSGTDGIISKTFHVALYITPSYYMISKSFILHRIQDLLSGTMDFKHQRITLKYWSFRTRIWNSHS